MASYNAQEWDVYYKSEHKVYAEMRRNISIENFVVTLLKKPEAAIGFKIVLRNVRNDMDFYSAHIIAPVYNDIKREFNLYSEFPALHKNMKLILDANKFDGNHVIMRLQENENGGIHIKIVFFHGPSQNTLLVYPVVMGTSYDIIYFLRREIDFEANMSNHYLMKTSVTEKELEKERSKSLQLFEHLQISNEKVSQLEIHNEQLSAENYQSRMHIVEIESANKINFRNLIAAEETIKRLNRFIIELRTNQDTSDPGVPYFMRAVLSLTEDVETSVRVPMPRYQLQGMLDVFSTGVLELAKVGTKLARILASKQEPNAITMQFRSTILSQTRLIIVLQDIWKSNRLTVDQATEIRKMIEGITFAIVRKYGNRSQELALVEASVSAPGHGSGLVPASDSSLVSASGSDLVSASGSGLVSASGSGSASASTSGLGSAPGLGSTSDLGLGSGCEQPN